MVAFILATSRLQCWPDIPILLLPYFQSDYIPLRCVVFVIQHCTESKFRISHAPFLNRFRWLITITDSHGMSSGSGPGPLQSYLPEMHESSFL